MGKKEESTELISCLRKETIIVRHIPKESDLVTDRRHLLYGGMADTSVRIFCVPMEGALLKRVLTDDEARFLEDLLKVEDNLMTCLDPKKSYFSELYPTGVHSVELTKADTRLDLSNPIDYIKYKILLANSNKIAPNTDALEGRKRKATYEYVLISEATENNKALTKMSNKKRAYVEYGKMENDVDKLRVAHCILTGRMPDRKTELSFLQLRIDGLIEENAKKFIDVVTAKNFETIVMIYKCVDARLITIRDSHFYLASDNSALCEKNGESSITVAAEYLMSAKHQDVRLSLEAQLNE